MRLKARVDANQKEIIDGLREVGASVQPLHTVGKGCPDLLVGYRGVNFLIECKDGSKPPSKQCLTPDQVVWHENWRGKVITVHHLGEALHAVSYRGE